ncbi:DEVIL-like protein [Trema orientale]|uniref:DEVIL-like protein n=1 Tax=Trema orientale TaxID=63057 RepID=A0A2P5FWY5_TREOI|nr:DEVIL-like protein [Trema orientale]
MTGQFPSNRVPKLRLWRKCSKLVKEQRTRFYIMWRCTVILLSWDDGV